MDCQLTFVSVTYKHEPDWVTLTADRAGHPARNIGLQGSFQSQTPDHQNSLSCAASTSQSRGVRGRAMGRRMPTSQPARPHPPPPRQAGRQAGR